MKVTVLHNQSFLDVAIQHTGTVLSAFEIAASNDMAVSDTLISGSTLIIPDTVLNDPEIRDYFKSKGIRPATAYTYELSAEEKGIGWMKIENTFKVG